MIRSLSIKLAMLAITIGVIFWIKWQPAELQEKDSISIDTSSTTVASQPVEAPAQTTPARRPIGGPITVISGEPRPVSLAGHATPRLVDLNRATVDELESLPGIGTVLARRVIAYRQSAGRFLAVEDLREVKGIGAKKFEQIKSLVTVARGEPKGKTEKRTS